MRAYLRVLFGVLFLPFYFCSAGEIPESFPQPNQPVASSKAVLIHESLLESYEGFVEEDRIKEIEPGSIKRTIECYPTEAYFGDTLYIAEFFENISDKTISGCYEQRPLVWDVQDVVIRISSPQIKSVYRWRFENPIGMGCLLFGPTRYFSLNPKDRFCFQYFYPELCPLEDFDAPFWKELREKLTPEGIVCKLEIEFHRDSSDAFTASQDILIKPRPAEEMALLEKWYKNTPKELFPFQYQGELPLSGSSKIQLSPTSSKTYDPWLFVRVGFRKPSDPNNPTSLDGWRELESNLIPSAMRDEVTLARFKMEFFAAEDALEENRIKEKYQNWLNSLPEIQRISMSRYPYPSTSREELPDPAINSKLEKWRQ